MIGKGKILFILATLLVIVMIIPAQLSAQGIPKVSLSIDDSGSPQDFSATLKI